MRMIEVELMVECGDTRLTHRAQFPQLPSTLHVVEAHGLSAQVRLVLHRHNNFPVLVLANQPKSAQPQLERAGGRVD